MEYTASDIFNDLKRILTEAKKEIAERGSTSQLETYIEYSFLPEIETFLQNIKDFNREKGV